MSAVSRGETIHGQRFPSLKSFLFQEHKTLEDAHDMAEAASGCGLHRAPGIPFKGPSPRLSSPKASNTSLGKLEDVEDGTDQSETEAGSGGRDREMPDLASMFFGTVEGGVVP